MEIININKNFGKLTESDIEEILALEPGFIFWSGEYFYSSDDEQSNDCFVCDLK